MTEQPEEQGTIIEGRKGLYNEDSSFDSRY